ncbi:MAG TPA: hypothetical protein VJG65_00490 [Patescibacteria group bacterium]|nr:hypothetical protein [Patescibacteria group bacterium]
MVELAPPQARTDFSKRKVYLSEFASHLPSPAVQAVGGQVGLLI